MPDAIFRGCPAVTVVALIFAGLLPGVVDPDLPSPAPVVNGMFPHGARRGTTTVIKLSGQNLEDAQSVEFSGKGIRGEIVSALGNSLQLGISVDEKAEPGLHDFRLLTSRGAYLGVFDIGTLPEIQEAEDNDNWRKPQVITLPVLVNGVIRTEDWDHFGFHSRAGQTLVFDVSATRHGSRLDADLAILDAKGNELAWVDDTTIFGDPHLQYTFTKEGDYIIRVGSLAGNPNADYRLSAGELPYVTRTFPAGLNTMEPATLELTGSHMDLVDEVFIGDRIAAGKIVKREPSRLEVRFQLPNGANPGPYRIHASSHGFEIGIPTELRISTLPEIKAAHPGLTLQTAVPVRPSVAINGIITERGKSHFYRFDAKEGEHFVFHAESMKLGYHLDPTLTIFDSEGKKAAYADDPGMDDRSDEYQLDPDLSFTAPRAGTWYVAIRDGMYRGGDQLLYRLTASRTAPDFLVELRDPLRTIYAGGDGTVQVRIRRRAGWDAPVKVWLEGLPQGITSEAQTADPKDSVVKDTCGVDRVLDGTIVMLPLHAADGAKLGPSTFLVKARGVVAGVSVEHQATSFYPHLSAGYIYGPAKIAGTELTVVPAPAVLLSMTDGWNVTPGSKQTLKVTIHRFGEMKNKPLTIRAQQVPNGLLLDSVQVSADSKEARLTATAGNITSSGTVILEALNAEGNAVGKSAPIPVEVRPEAVTRK